MSERVTGHSEKTAQTLRKLTTEEELDIPSFMRRRGKMPGRS